jgi:hypothetical protein
MLPYLDPRNQDHPLRYKRIFTETEYEKPMADETEAVGNSGQLNAEEAEQRRAWNVYLSQLHRRIFRVLRGHMVWICAKAECSELESFYPHHWPDGRRISYLEWLSPTSLIDTPLQLLKVFCYYKLAKSLPQRILKRWNRAKELCWIQKSIRSKARIWIDRLHSSNERGTYAFCHPVSMDYDNEQDRKYRLTDHVLIGLALKAVEELKLQTKYRIWPYYTYEEVRRKILKRFTVENPISKQKMLATSRWNDATRFLLHSKDTLLFSTEGLEYLQDPVMLERKQKGSKGSDTIDMWKYADQRWTKLLGAQAYHQEFQSQEWDNPLWYAIVCLLAFKEIRINNKTSGELMKSSRPLLFATSSYNGLFAGQLGRDNIPEMFDDEYNRDDYWFRTFEIVRILWGLRITARTDTSDDELSMRSRTDSASSGALAVSIETSKVGQKIEKHFIFSNIDPSKNQRGMVALSDDWLQASPAFLDFSSDTEVDTEDSADGNTVSLLKKIPFILELSPGMAGVVINVPKWSLGTEISEPQLASHELVQELNQQTAWESKKRIVWLTCFDRAAIQKCLDVSSPVEKENLAAFLKRYLECEKYFLDSASAELNEWETELHFSFFRITSMGEGSLHELESQSFLTSTTMSLRFSGDFSDRYWLCYFLDSQIHQADISGGITLGERLRPSKDCGIRDRRDLGLMASTYYNLDAAERLYSRQKTRTARSWQQRRVLELLIYSKMLEELRESASGILRSVKRLALRSHNDKHFESNSNSFQAAIQEANRLQKLGEKEDYASIAREWRRYIQILVVVEENLIDNIEKIDQWEQRERDRQSQQPRWTERDIRDHFTTILRLTILTQRQGSGIRRLKDNVRAFHGSLPGQLESIREDISFRGSENIGLFTYVTVFFLPLGFATGVLSMNGIPDHSLLKNLVYLALVAFGLTVIALINARSAKNILPLFLRFPQRLIKHIIFHRLAVPIISRLAERRKHEDQNKRNEPDQELYGSELEPAMYKSAVMASSHGLPAMATAEPPPILASPNLLPQEPHFDGQVFTRVRSMRPPENWQEKYQDILHFSFLRAVRKEERKQSQLRVQQKTVQTQKPGSFSLKGLIYRQKRNGDVEQGDGTDSKTKSTRDSGQLAIWPAEFSGMDESLFDD